MYGLISLDLTQIKPNYDAMVKGGTLRISDDGYAQGENIFGPLIFVYWTSDSMTALNRKVFRIMSIVERLGQMIFF